MIDRLFNFTGIVMLILGTLMIGLNIVMWISCPESVTSWIDLISVTIAPIVCSIIFYKYKLQIKNIQGKLH